MRLRTDVLGRSCPVLEEKSSPLACAPARGRRRAVRAKSVTTLHKVGCSWSARHQGAIPDGSAGPTTPPRFEPSGIAPWCRQTGEPTVSHEGCSGLDFSSAFSVPSTHHVLEEESKSLACAPAQGRRRAVRAKSVTTLHKVGCSWSARHQGAIPDGSAGPTTPPRFEPSGIAPWCRQTGEPTVSHEGCSETDSSSIFSLTSEAADGR